MKHFAQTLLITLCLLLSTTAVAGVESCPTYPDKSDFDTLGAFMRDFNIQYKRDIDDDTCSNDNLRWIISYYSKNLSRKSLESLIFYFIISRDNVPAGSNKLVAELCKNIQSVSAKPMDILPFLRSEFSRDAANVGTCQFNSDSFHLALAAMSDSDLQLAHLSQTSSSTIFGNLMKRRSLTRECINKNDMAFKGLRLKIRRLQKFMRVLAPLTEPSKEKAKCCICYYDKVSEDDQRLYENFFYRVGCKKWLSEQADCEISEAQVEPDTPNSPETLSIPSSCQGGLLKLGHVGHSGPGSAINFLQKRLTPTAKYNRTSIEYDDTACSTMQNIDDVKSALDAENQDLPENKKIKLGGNQCVSIGVWNRYFGGANNFRATVSSDSDKPIFPICSDYYHKSCSGMFQDKATGQCTDESDDIVDLTCCDRTVEYEYYDPNFIYATRKATRDIWAWGKASECKDTKYTYANQDEEFNALADSLLKKWQVIWKAIKGE